MQGTRVDSMGAVWDGDPGVYCPLKNDDGAVTALWFKLPTGSLGRIANAGHGNGEEPEWTITENPDGTITVDPSIEQKPVPGAPGHPATEYWHGFLRNGVWEG